MASTILALLASKRIMLASRSLDVEVALEQAQSDPYYVTSRRLRKESNVNPGRILLAGCSRHSLFPRRWPGPWSFAEAAVGDHTLSHQHRSRKGHEEPRHLWLIRPGQGTGRNVDLCRHTSAVRSGTEIGVPCRSCGMVSHRSGAAARIASHEIFRSRFRRAMGGI